MPQAEEKSVPYMPHVNFIWAGEIKSPNCSAGPISLAEAKNNVGLSYSITYWVEEEQIHNALERFADYPNIEVKSINEAIKQYCGEDANKEKKIYELLSNCKKEDFPNVPKEILAPIIQSLYPGYFFDTTIKADTVVELPLFTKPALSRNIDIIPGSDSAQITDGAADLYSYFSSSNSSGQISLESKKFFTNLAEDTISTWENLFQNGLPKNWLNLPPGMLNQIFINTFLLGPISKLYAPKIKEDGEIEFVVNEKGKLISLDSDTKLPSNKTSDLPFTTIDALQIEGLTDKGIERKLYCEGQNTGISKFLNGLWKTKFLAYVERVKLKADSTKYKESKPETPSKLSESYDAFFTPPDDEEEQSWEDPSQKDYPSN